MRPSTRLEIAKRISYAKELLDSQKSETFNLDELATACSLSKFFLIRSFKQVFSKTPHQYFIERKIDRARNLLKQGRTVTDTAITLGYPDIFSFSRQFRKIT